MRHVDPRVTVSGADITTTGDTATSEAPRLRIVHCFRAPVGGLFRHVRDLAQMQAKAGHQVGVVADASTGGPDAEAAFAALAPSLALGIHRVPMSRDIALSDAAAAMRVAGEVRKLRPDVLHGHGAKGGVYARTAGTLARATGVRVGRIYTPHGGSLHFDPASTKGRIYFTAERVLARMTDAFVFVCQYERDTFVAKVGKPRVPAVVALNGLRPEEFEPVVPADDARDFLVFGEIRDLKGPDVFVAALADLAKSTGRAPTAVMVGGGPDKAQIEAMAKAMNVGDAITFPGPMRPREAFARARALVMPSRAESLPYGVLEAAAAGLPIIATNVGGMSEIFGEAATRLLPPGDNARLAEAMGALLADPKTAAADARSLNVRVRQIFSVSAMASAVESAYRAAVAR